MTTRNGGALQPPSPPWILTERQYPDALTVQLFYLLANGTRRPVLIGREHDNPGTVAAIGDALAADRVVSKEEATRLGWRATG